MCGGVACARRSASECAGESLGYAPHERRAHVPSGHGCLLHPRISRHACNDYGDYLGGCPSPGLVPCDSRRYAPRCRVWPATSPCSQSLGSYPKEEVSHEGSLQRRSRGRVPRGPGASRRAPLCGSHHGPGHQAPVSRGGLCLWPRNRERLLLRHRPARGHQDLRGGLPQDRGRDGQDLQGEPQV